MILSDANKTTKAASKNTCKCRTQTYERKNTSLLNKNTPHDTRSHTRALNIALAVELIYAAVTFPFCSLFPLTPVPSC